MKFENLSFSLRLQNMKYHQHISKLLELIHHSFKEHRNKVQFLMLKVQKLSVLNLMSCAKHKDSLQDRKLTIMFYSKQF